jgi:hypothetical protein
MLQALGLHQIAYLKLLFRGKVLLAILVMPLQQELEIPAESVVVVEVVAVMLANQHRSVAPLEPTPRPVNREQLEQLEHLIRQSKETPEVLDKHL